ncbi:MAG: hypothetical protein IH985_08110, partial [Planctomycetes bacterium]|nr:hypothetical protein [Planctomycetota bacterium]
CRVAVNQSAAHEKDNTIRFRLPQFRLIGVGGGRSEPRVYLAAGMTDLYINDKHLFTEVTPEQSTRLVRFDSQTNFILSPVNTRPVHLQVSDGSGGARTGGYEFDVAFEVPDDFEPSYLEFKRGARFTFPRGDDDSLYLADSPDYASSAMGGGTVQARSGGGSSVGQAPGGRVHVANAVTERTGVFTELPVALDMSSPIVSRWTSGNRLRGGDGCHFSVVLPQGDLDPALRVTEFTVPAGKKMLQVGAERLQAESMYGRALSFATRVMAQIFVRDSSGKEYFAIGQYAAVDIGGQVTFEIQYYPDVLVTGMPERCLKPLKTVKASMLRSAGRENSKFGYIFLVDPGVTIVSFHAGARSGNSQPLNLEVGP